MNGSNGDLRGLLRSVAYPSSNEQYIADQQTLNNLYKEPGMFVRHMEDDGSGPFNEYRANHVLEFFLALQELAADKSVSHGERLLASIISGRELKNKWRNKTCVVARSSAFEG